MRSERRRKHQSERSTVRNATYTSKTKQTRSGTQRKLKRSGNPDLSGQRQANDATPPDTPAQDQPTPPLS